MYISDLRRFKAIKSKISGMEANHSTRLNTKVDFLFGQTSDHKGQISGYLEHLSAQELLRAERFHFDSDRETYIVSHGLLRQVLAERLNISPSEISFNLGKHNKPELKANSCYFNISHTRNAFSIALSNEMPVGIDIEVVNKDIDLHSIMKIVFNKNEQEYVLSKTGMEAEYFTLLWTRKEALLKAIGIGIIDELKEIDVSENFTHKREIFDRYGVVLENDHLSIHSEIREGHILSLAAWGNVKANHLSWAQKEHAIAI